MTFEETLDQAIAMLQRRGRLTYRTLQLQLQLDEAHLEALKDELIYGQRLAADEDGRVLVWTGETGTASPAIPVPVGTPGPATLAYTPPYLAEKILTSRSALEGERKQVTVLFADLKGSMELLADRDPEEARQLLDPVLERMIEAVHRYEGTVNQVMGDGQVVALVGEPGVGKSRLVYECLHSHRTQGWLVLACASISYGTATPYDPVIDLLKRYLHIKDGDEPHTVRTNVTGHLLGLDETLQDTIPALLALLDALPADSPFLTLDPPQRRQRTLTALKRVLFRESQVQPLLLVFEDLHWIDAETQALLDNLVESLPTARILLLVNYRPEYQHGWGGKTYYTQRRLDPLPPGSTDEILQAYLGDDPSLAPLKRLLLTRTAVSTRNGVMKPMLSGSSATLRHSPSHQSAAKLKLATGKPWPGPRHSVCARFRPIATSALAHCMPR
jgi:hypothetical protein